MEGSMWDHISLDGSVKSLMRGTVGKIPSVRFGTKTEAKQRFAVSSGT